MLLDYRGYLALLHLYLARSGYTSGPLFRASINGRGGGPLSYDAAHNRWKKYCAAASIGIGIHQLRHAHATELQQRRLHRGRPPPPRPRLHRNHQVNTLLADQVADAEIRAARRSLSAASRHGHPPWRQPGRRGATAAALSQLARTMARRPADKAVNLAIDTGYWLTGGVISQNPAAVLDMARRMNTGIIHIRDPTSRWRRFRRREELRLRQIRRERRHRIVHRTALGHHPEPRPGRLPVEGRVPVRKPKRRAGSDGLRPVLRASAWMVTA